MVTCCFPGLIRLQQVFQELGKREFELVDFNVRKVENANETHKIMRMFVNEMQESDIRVLLDISITEAEKLLVMVVSDIRVLMDISITDAEILLTMVVKTKMSLPGSNSAYTRP